MNLTLTGLVLIAFGVVYLQRPTLYRRGIWLKTSIAIRFLSEEGYKKYIKLLGILFILIGTCLIAWEQVFVRLGLLQ
jgi:hypothetical protein